MTAQSKEGEHQRQITLIGQIKELQEISQAIREKSNLSVIAALRLMHSFSTTFDDSVKAAATSAKEKAKKGAASEGESKRRKLSSSVVNESRQLVRIFNELETATGRKYLTHDSPKQLTPDGEEFLRKSQTLVTAFDDLFSSPLRTTVHVSCIDMACNFWIPEALAQAEFFDRPENKNVNLRIRVCEWHEVQEDVRSGLADFGIGTTMPSGGVESRQLLNRPHMLLAHEKYHGLPPGLEMPMSELKGKRIAILRSYIAPVNVEMKLRENDVRDFTIIEAFTSAQLLSFVREQVAVAIITPDVVPVDSRIRVFQLTSARIPLLAAADSIYYLDQTKHPMPPAAQRMLEKIESYWHNVPKWLERRCLADLVEVCMPSVTH